MGHTKNCKRKKGASGCRVGCRTGHKDLSLLCQISQALKHVNVFYLFLIATLSDSLSPEFLSSSTPFETELPGTVADIGPLSCPQLSLRTPGCPLSCRNRSCAVCASSCPALGLPSVLITSCRPHLPYPAPCLSHFTSFLATTPTPPTPLLFVLRQVLSVRSTAEIGLDQSITEDDFQLMIFLPLPLNAGVTGLCYDSRLLLFTPFLVAPFNHV